MSELRLVHIILMTSQHPGDLRLLRISRVRVTRRVARDGHNSSRQFGRPEYIPAQPGHLHRECPALGLHEPRVAEGDQAAGHERFVGADGAPPKAMERTWSAQTNRSVLPPGTQLGASAELGGAGPRSWARGALDARTPI